MIKFSREKVLQLHRMMADTTGGSIGVREDALLESALESPFSRFGDQITGYKVVHSFGEPKQRFRREALPASFVMNTIFQEDVECNEKLRFNKIWYFKGGKDVNIMSNLATASPFLVSIEALQREHVHLAKACVQALAAKDRALAAKDRVLAAKDRALADKDKEIARLRRFLKKRSKR